MEKQTYKIGIMDDGMISNFIPLGNNRYFFNAFRSKKEARLELAFVRSILFPSLPKQRFQIGIRLNEHDEYEVIK